MTIVSKLNWIQPVDFSFSLISDIAQLFNSLMRIIFNRSQLGSSSNAIRSRRNSWRWCFIDIILSRSSNNVVYFKGLLPLLFISDCPLRISEYHLLSLFLFIQISTLLQLWQGNHPLFVNKVRYCPLPFLLIPVRIVNYHLQLVWIHKNADDGLEFFNLFLLVSYSIQQLLFLIFMLILDISEFR